MNLLTNPGFEDGTAPWLFGTGAALVTDGSGRGGGNCARVQSTYINTTLPPAPPVYLDIEGRVYQLPVWDTGWICILSGYAKKELEWGTLTITSGPRTVITWPASSSTDWSMQYGIHYVNDPTEYFEIRANKGSGEGVSSWMVDDLTVELGGRAMARSIYNSYTALYNLLKNINGSSGKYHHDINDAVIPKLVLPGEPGAPVMPYICLPLSDSGAYDHSERGVRAALRQQIVAFIPESESTSITDCSSIKALKMHDDILKCVMPTEPATGWNLGDSNVEDVQLISKDIRAGQNDGIPWAEVSVTVDIFCRFARGDLGTP